MNMATKKKTAAETPTDGRDTSIARNLDALRLVDPGQWRDKIVQAFREQKGNAVKTAEQLGVGHRTLLRYMKDPVLAVAVEKVRAAAAKEAAKARA